MEKKLREKNDEHLKIYELQKQLIHDLKVWALSFLVYIEMVERGNVDSISFNNEGLPC